MTAHLLFGQDMYVAHLQRMFGVEQPQHEKLRFGFRGRSFQGKAIAINAHAGPETFRFDLMWSEAGKVLASTRQARDWRSKIDGCQMRYGIVDSRSHREAQQVAKSRLRSKMKCLIPMHPEAVDTLRREKETGPGYHVVALELKDGRHFDQVVVSEGCVISVRGYRDVPFDISQVANIEVNHKRWNFRKWTDVRREKAKAASA